MKCKHCDVPLVSRPFPMLPGQIVPSGIYWVHDYGTGVLMVSGYNPVSHYAEPAATLKTCRNCLEDITRKTALNLRGQIFSIWKHVHNDFTFCSRGVDDNWNRAEPEPAPYVLHIYLKQTRQWERQECGSLELRDELRAVWQRNGNCTAVEV